MGLMEHLQKKQEYLVGTIWIFNIAMENPL